VADTAAGTAAGATAGTVTTRPAPVDYTVFDTAAGRCTIAWRAETTTRDSYDEPGPAVGPSDTGNPSGIDGRCGTDSTPGPVAVVATALPDVRSGRGAVYVRRRFPGATLATGIAPPPVVQAAIDGIRTLLAGEPTDLTSVPLDMTDIPEFHQHVYAAARRIPPGATRTYGELADQLGDSTLARAVGQALGRNPFPIVVPCHRVLGARGAIGGFSADGGTSTKRRLLRIEGALPEPLPTLFDDDPSVPADRFA
jgi:methylated-DNA-[protein]-cysteine S-methyltransferase